MNNLNLDWNNLGFDYRQTSKRYVSNYENNSWDEGNLTEDANVVINECAGVLQYAQTCFEGLKAYRRKDGKIVLFRPDLNAERLEESSKRLYMPVVPKEKFLEAVEQTVLANADFVPPYGSGATLYIRPYIFGSGSVIGVKPDCKFQFRVFTTPVGPYFKDGVKPLSLCVSDFDRAAPSGTGHVKAGLNYAMSLHALQVAHENGFDENVCLSLLTSNPAKVLGVENSVGKLDIGMSADFLVSDGVPGLDITNPNQISAIFINGKKLISR